jgi:hypothetical protein
MRELNMEAIINFLKDIWCWWQPLDVADKVGVTGAIVATYAAVLATLPYIWKLYRYFFPKKMDLKITAETILLMGHTKERDAYGQHINNLMEHIDVKIKNREISQTTTIEKIGLIYYKNILAKLIQKPDTAGVVHRTVPLDPGQPHEQPIKIEADLKQLLTQNKTYIFVQHSMHDKPAIINYKYHPLNNPTP